VWQRHLRDHERALGQLGQRRRARDRKLRGEYVLTDVRGRQQRQLFRELRRSKHQGDRERPGVQSDHNSIFARWKVHQDFLGAAAIPYVIALITVPLKNMGDPTNAV
jgi:hypothetical protein